MRFRSLTFLALLVFARTATAGIEACLPSDLRTFKDSEIRKVVGNFVGEFEPGSRNYREGIAPLSANERNASLIQVSPEGRAIRNGVQYTSYDAGVTSLAEQREGLREYETLLDLYVLERNSQSGHFETRVWPSSEDVKHSSFNGGKPVFAGGELGFRDGLLRYVNNTSGHYAPNSTALKKFIIQLHEQGFDLRQTLVFVGARDEWATFVGPALAFVFYEARDCIRQLEIAGDPLAAEASHQIALWERFSRFSFLKRTFGPGGFIPHERGWGEKAAQTWEYFVRMSPEERLQLSDIAKGPEGIRFVRKRSFQRFLKGQLPDFCRSLLDRI